MKPQGNPFDHWIFELNGKGYSIEYIREMSNEELVNFIEEYAFQRYLEGCNETEISYNERNDV